MPLSNLDAIARRPDAPILILQFPEGTDASDDLIAARSLYGSFVVLTCDGTEAHVDALAGRDVVLWPFQTPGNRRDTATLARRIAAVAERCRTIDPDSPGDWIGPADLQRRLNGHGSPAEWAKSRVTVVPAPMPDEPEPATSDEPETDPVDLFTRLPLPTIQREWLPPEIADYILDQSEIIGTDPCILTVSCLVACAAVCSDAIKIQPLRHNTGWTESARLWGAFVGDPSVKKTPALKAAIAHLQRINMDLAEKSAADLDLYRRELKLHEKIEAAWIKQAASRGRSGALDPPPQKPAMRQLIANDITVEALGILMQDNPGGILLLHDELASFFGSIDAYSKAQGKDGPFHLQAYNGGPHLVNRVGREPLRIRNASECILGGIQPDAMAKIAAKLPNDGLLQRFMVVIARPVPGDGVDREPDREAMATWRQVVDGIAREAPRADPAVTLSEGAMRVREALVRDLGALRDVYAASPRLTSHLGKWSALFVRLCLVYHAIRCSAHGEPIAGEVSPETARRVARFMVDYLFEHTRAFHEDLLSDNWTDEYVKWIAGYIISRRLESVTLRELYRAYRSFAQLGTERQRAVMQFLVYFSWLTPVERSNPGVPSQRWSVNPRVHTLFGDVAVAEADRRKSARELVAAKAAQGKGA